LNLILGILNLLFVCLNVFLNNFEFFFAGYELGFRDILDRSLLADLRVDRLLVRRDFLFLNDKLLLFLEAFNLLLDNLNFFFFLFDFFFLGVNDDLSDSDLLLDYFLFDLFLL